MSTNLQPLVSCCLYKDMKPVVSDKLTCYQEYMKNDIYYHIYIYIYIY